MTYCDWRENHGWIVRRVNHGEQLAVLHVDGEAGIDVAATVADQSIFRGRLGGGLEPEGQGEPVNVLVGKIVVQELHHEEVVAVEARPAVHGAVGSHLHVAVLVYRGLVAAGVLDGLVERYVQNHGVVVTDCGRRERRVIW